MPLISPLMPVVPHFAIKYNALKFTKSCCSEILLVAHSNTNSFYPPTVTVKNPSLTMMTVYTMVKKANGLLQKLYVASGNFSTTPPLSKIQQ